ncbi:MAG TPA: hypothetical protein VIX11_00990 [Candidatus Acidoferrum sp.]
MSLTKRLLSATFLGSIALFLAFTPTRVVQGRSAPPQQAVDTHMHAPANIIDGSVHPEMIQDQVAFRLFFLAAATGSNPSPQDKERQRAMLSPARLSEEELAISSTALANYQGQYEAVVQRFNDAVASAGSPEQLPDGKQLVAELDALALAVKTKLESSISGASSLRLYAHVQGEKSKMRVTAEQSN